MTKKPQQNYKVSFYGGQGYNIYSTTITSTTRDGAKKKCLTKYKGECRVLKIEEID